MRTIKLAVLVLAVATAFFFQACSGTKVDYETGEPTNRPRGVPSDERVELATDNQDVKNIQNADLVLVPTKGEVYVIDPETKKYAGTLTNPHPDEAQYATVWDEESPDKLIWDGWVGPRMIQHFFVFAPSDDDHKVFVKWTNGFGESTTMCKVFPKGPAKSTDALGNPSHLNFNGYGKTGYKKNEAYQYQGEVNSNFYHRLESPNSND